MIDAKTIELDRHGFVPKLDEDEGSFFERVATQKQVTNDLVTDEGLHMLSTALKQQGLLGDSDDVKGMKRQGALDEVMREFEKGYKTLPNAFPIFEAPLSDIPIDSQGVLYKKIGGYTASVPEEFGGVRMVIGNNRYPKRMKKSVRHELIHCVRNPLLQKVEAGVHTDLDEEIIASRGDCLSTLLAGVQKPKLLWKYWIIRNRLRKAFGSMDKYVELRLPVSNLNDIYRQKTNPADLRDYVRAQARTQLGYRIIQAVTEI